MKRIALANRILSLGLAVALAASSPMSVYAGEETDAPVEASVQISEGAASSDVTSSDGSNSSESGQPESGNAASTNDGKADGAQTGEDGVVDSIVDKVNNDIDNVEGQTIISGNPSTEEDVPEATDEDVTDTPADAAEVVDEDSEVTEDELDAEDAEDEELEETEDEEYEYTYVSNNDGTHTKSWTDADGEYQEETEECEFDENGICIYCGYEKPVEEEDEEIVLADENGLVRITAKKSVLNGAEKVTATEITEESNSEQYAQMSEALDETTNDETTVVDFVAYDINLYNADGDVVEPTGEVKVEFTNLSIEGLEDEDASTEVYHYVDDSASKVEDVSTNNENVEMTTDHFSTYIIAVSKPEGLFASNYIYLYGYNYQYDWEYRSSLFANNGNRNNGYYINNSGKKYTYIPLQIRVYLDDNTVPVETHSYAYLQAGSYYEKLTEWFGVLPFEGYSLTQFKTGSADMWSSSNPASFYNMNNMSEATFNGGYYGCYLYNYLNGDYKNNSSNSYSCKRTINFVDIYLTTDEAADITISGKNLLTEGTIEATLSDAKLAEYADKTIQYRWSKNVNDAGFDNCKNTEYENLGNSINDNKINIVLDKGTLSSTVNSVKYKVEAYYVDENNIEQVIATSDEYDVTYYNSLQNGSFETPKLDAPMAQYSNSDYLNAGGVWQSTGTGKNESGVSVNIEIIDTTINNSWVASAYSWYNNNGYDRTVYAPDGTQFAEINCEAEGALYQDVLTIKGEELNYWFSHRARGNNRNYKNYNVVESDTMYVVIMPVDDAKDIDTQSELSTYLASKKDINNMKDGEVYRDESTGVLIAKVTDDDQSWQEYVGTYTPTSYATRFYFLAGTTASGNKTVGNFIDKVGFSQDLPPVVEGEFVLSFTKTINGLSNNQNELNQLLDSLYFEIEAVDSDGNVVTTAPLNGTTIKADDDTVTKETKGSSIVLSWTSGGTNIGNDSYYYIIREKNAELDNSEYVLKAITRYSKSDNVDEKAFSDESDNEEIYLKLSSESNATFKFTNSYSVKSTITDSALIDKRAYVTDFDNRTYNVELDTLNYTIDRKNGLAPVDVVLLIDISGSMNFPSDLEKVTINSIQEMDTSTTYYYIEQDSQAKVNRVSYQRGRWVYRDAAYEDKDKSPTDFSLGNKQLYVQKQGGHDRKYYLTNAAEKLIDSLPDGSNVSLVTFANSASIRTLSGSNQVICLDSNDARNSVKNAIESAYGDVSSRGGTNQYDALDKAKTLLSQNSVYLESDYDKAVILISDGCPNATVNNTRLTADMAISKASEVKALDSKPEIYSIGIDLDINSAMDDAKTLLRGCATDSYYYNSKAEYLDVIFQMIAAKLTDASIYATTGTVRDVVDARFDVYDDAGNKIVANGEYTLGGKKAYVTLNEDGTATIDWSGQALGTIDTQNNTVSKWSVTIKIAAKADFLGGNEIATNGPSSGVYVEGSDPELFPEPSVNVKELPVTIENGVETKFLGEQLEVYTQQQALEYLRNTISGISTDGISAVSTDENGNLVVSQPYSYANTNDPVGTIKYTLSKSSDEVFCDENGIATKVGIPVQVYTLTAEYIPYTLETRIPMTTTKDLNTPVEKDGATPQQTTATNSTSLGGTYTINVITADILLTKYGQSYGDNPTKELLGGAEFIYYINENSPLDKKTSDNSSSNKGKLSFTNVKYGTSYVKESKAPTGYMLNGNVYTVSVAHLNNTEDYVITITSTDTDFANVTKTVDVSELMNAAQPSTTAAQLSFEVLNQKAYTLPETGGRGIYVYTIGGVLLMLGASLMLYKNKKNQKNIK